MTMQDEDILKPGGLARWIWQHFVGIPGADLPPYDAEFNLLLDNVRRIDRAAFTKGLHEARRQYADLTARLAESQAGKIALLSYQIEQSVQEFVDRCVLENADLRSKLAATEQEKQAAVAAAAEQMRELLSPPSHDPLIEFRRTADGEHYWLRCACGWNINGDILSVDGWADHLPSTLKGPSK